MPKYIDADKPAAELSAGGIPINEQDIAGILGDMSSIQDYIDDAPSEDVTPVRHGEWFGTVCTACGESTSYYFNCDYCPNCGAKMDGETDQSNTGHDMIQWEDDLMKSQDDKKKRRISKLHRILGGLLLGISLLGFSFVVGSGAGAIMAISGTGICFICLLWLKMNGGNQNDK